MSSVVFGLSNTAIRCGDSMTLDDFRDGLLVDGKPNEPDPGLQGHGSGFNSDKVRRNISFLDFFVPTLVRIIYLWQRDLLFKSCYQKAQAKTKCPL